MNDHVCCGCHDGEWSAKLEQMRSQVEALIATLASAVILMQANDDLGWSDQFVRAANKLLQR